MGGTRYSSTAYTAATETLKATGATFAHSAKVASTGDYSDISELLDPKKLKNGMRESCFAEGFEDATPMVVGIDCTGSMQDVPGQVRDSIPTLMDITIEKGLSDHPNVMFIGLDDEHYVTNAAFQISQFETGHDELLSALNDLVIPGRGGSNSGEAYHLFFYALANHTKLECFDRDGEKGFAFLICDEQPYYDHHSPLKYGTTPDVAKDVFGDSIQAEVSMLDSLKKTAERYHVFILRPHHTSNGTNMGISKKWQDLLSEAGINPQHVIEVEKTENLVSTMVLAMSRIKGADTTEVVSVLKEKGVTGVDSIVESTKAIAPVMDSAVAVGSVSGELDTIDEEEESEVVASGRERL